MYRKLRVAGMVGAGMLVAIIIVQNTASVETRILFFTLTMPRAALLFGTALIGFAIGVLFATRMGRRPSR